MFRLRGCGRAAPAGSYSALPVRRIHSVSCFKPILSNPVAGGSISRSRNPVSSWTLHFSSAVFPRLLACGCACSGRFVGVVLGASGFGRDLRAQSAAPPSVCAAAAAAAARFFCALLFAQTLLPLPPLPLPPPLLRAFTAAIRAPSLRVFFLLQVHALRFTRFFTGGDASSRAFLRAAQSRGGVYSLPRKAQSEDAKTISVAMTAPAYTPTRAMISAKICSGAC